MNLINIFHSGLGLVHIVFIAIIAIFAIQGITESRKVGIPFYKSSYSIVAAVAFVIWVVAILIMASDYKGV